MTLREKLIELKACPEAIEWVGDRDLPTAWAECQRGDWMLWLVESFAGRPGWPRYREIVLCACEISERALRYVAAGETRPRLAIEAARRCAEDPTAKNRSAARSARSAARNAAWSAAESARNAAWSAAESARNAAWSAAESARNAARSAQADICRKWLTPGEL